EAAIRYILERTLQVHEDQMDLIVEALVSGEREFSTELKSGVVVPHTRLMGLEEPLLFLGTSREGIVFPNARDPARLIFILLSPTDRPQDHLTALGEIARLVSNEEAVQELLGDQPVTGRGSGTVT